MPCSSSEDVDSLGTASNCLAAIEHSSGKHLVVL